MRQVTPHISAGRFAQAIALLRRAVEKEPANYQLLDTLTDMLCKTDQHAQAVFLLENASRLAPIDRRFLMLAGDTQMRAAKYDAAAELFVRAYRADPSDIEPLRARCIAMYQGGHYTESLAEAKRIFTERAADPRALALYSGMCELAGDLDELIRVLTKALERSPSDPTILSALLLPLTRVHGLDPRIVFRHHARLGELMMEMMKDQRAYYMRPHANIPDPNRPLHIGYCSQDFRNRSAGHFIEPIITNHDKSLYKVFIFHNVVGEDELTKRIRKHAERYFDTSRLDDKKLTDLIRDCRIDILVDLSGHTGWGRLVPFTLKPAPIQYTYMGYPNTTGLPTIDYRIVDWFTDPAGSEHLATETLVRMDGSFLCYTPPHHASDPAPAPSLANKYVTFGSFNTLTKVGNPVLEIWAKILHAVPNSRLFLKAMAVGVPAAQERVWRRLEELGIARDRVTLMGETKGKSEHLATYSQIDIGLDPWPYNGTTTTVEAMYMGVPVVTIEGNNHVSRVGVSLLNNIGLPEHIAKDPEDYIRICVELAANEARRVELRSGLRQMVLSSPLCDHVGFTRRLEAHYRQAWMGWCVRKMQNPAL